MRGSSPRKTEMSAEFPAHGSRIDVRDFGKFTFHRSYVSRRAARLIRDRSKLRRPLPTTPVLPCGKPGNGILPIRRRNDRAAAISRSASRWMRGLSPRKTKVSAESSAHGSRICVRDFGKFTFYRSYVSRRAARLIRDRSKLRRPLPTTPVLPRGKLGKGLLPIRRRIDRKPDFTRNACCWMRGSSSRKTKAPAEFPAHGSRIGVRDFGKFIAGHPTLAEAVSRDAGTYSSHVSRRAPRLIRDRSKLRPRFWRPRSCLAANRGTGFYRFAGEMIEQLPSSGALPTGCAGRARARRRYRQSLRPMGPGAVSGTSGSS